MVKLAQVKTRQFLDFLQTVDQSIAVDKQLPRGLGYVQIVLKELLNGKERLMV